ncbi:hypothetical protein A7K50_03300 [Dehalobacter sp. MCB1]|uniref:ribosomal-processing cysteine protease Prp n=1 Tax=Dehalobacter sp. MCB1 TaxID=1844756 RepID=UPI000E6BCEEB|nr:ribosomal-processing cysteine protease Prp [Dehalobacter sp. MCB1]RJE47687.1 hypothetical protein A7K50_03300 [Dehalobacter sp. MCB1]
MIKVSVSNNGFSVHGHANFKPYGEDIVCSAVSAITQSIANGLYKFCDASYASHEGLLAVYVSNPDDCCKALLFSLRYGLQQIQKEFPEYLSLTEVWDCA